MTDHRPLIDHTRSLFRDIDRIYDLLEVILEKHARPRTRVKAGEAAAASLALQKALLADLETPDCIHAQRRKESHGGGS